MKKNIFITGIAGFLGANLADFYLKKGFKVSGCDNLVGGDIKNIDLKFVFRDEIQLHILFKLSLSKVPNPSSINI